MSFPNKLQSARAPTDQEIFQVRNICTPLKDKPFLILGESTPMTSGKYYNCFGWALQKPIEFVDPANHTEPLNKQWVKQQLELNHYVETSHKEEADIEVYYNAHDKIVHFTRLYNKDKNQYTSKLGNGGPLIVHMSGAIDGEQFGYAKEYYKGPS